jgi:error-prone DNA polymerase
LTSRYVMPEYVELHCHTNYSLLDGASHPEELLDRAGELGMDSLAVTDHDGLYGAVRFWRAARERGIKSLVGAELTLDGGYHLTLLARNNTGYSNLSRLISHAQLSNSKGQASLPFNVLAQHTGGLICLSGCSEGEIAKHLLAGRDGEALAAGERYLGIFGRENFWIELQRHFLPEDRRLVSRLVELAGHLGVGYVATNNVHYARREGHCLHDVLTCIAHLTTLDEANSLLRPNSEYYLKPTGEMEELFSDLPRAVASSRAIAERCDVDLNFSAHRLPTFDLPPGEKPLTYLRRLCLEGAGRKYHPVTERVLAQLDRELGVIERTGLAGYFLIVWDICRYAHERGIPAQGRGSAANSLAAYLLDITRVDPIAHNLLFERFLNEEANTMPDIDVDFSTNHREEVIDYVYEKYGEEHTAMVCNVVTYRARSAVRDVGKALGFPLPLLDQVAKALDTRQASAVEDELERINGFAEKTDYLPWQQLIELCREIDTFPRHLSIHVGGMLITAKPLVEIAPLERATMPGRVVVQFNKDDVEDLGLIKIDLLSLRTLSLIYDALQLIREHRGIELDLESVPLDDPTVYDMLCRVDTIGTFQVESRAQAQTLPRMGPRRFEDIVVEVALIRPGPIQGNMVHPYLQRRAGREEVTYLHPALEPILEETLGVIIFQEQVLKVAMAIAGFTPGEADMLRRAMSRHRSHQEMEKLRARFIAGALENGVEESVAEEIFRQLAGFAEFGFCKSHAAAFARTAYETVYLKAYYPAEFYCALLNNQPMGFYSPAVIVGDAKRHGVKILPVNVNRSQAKCTVEKGRLRLGFAYVDSLGEASLEILEQAREGGPYASLRGFCQRTKLSRKAIENLIMVGAMDCWGKPRRELVWELGTVRYDEGEMDLSPPLEEIDLPQLSQAEELRAEYGILGLPVGDQVMALYRPELEKLGVLTSKQLEGKRNGEKVKVAGMAVVRQRPPTAKGFVFITLEDEEGLMNVIVRPDVYERYYRTIRNSLLMIVEGTVQRQGGLINVLAEGAVGM